MSIRQEIENWDGRSAADIGEIYNHHYRDEGFVSTMVNFIDIVSLQKGTTWLLKKYLENGNQISTAENSAIYKKLEKLHSWESRLHILQSLPFLLIPKKNKLQLERFLKICLVERNKFVRAWAYNGFYELAVQYPEHVEETKCFFEMAMRDEAPSVKSRIRNIMKKGF